MKNNQASIRYWGAIGLGNLGLKAKSSSRILTNALNDKSASVRIAAARALCLMDMEQRSIFILAQELSSSNEWARLNAAIVLDEIGEKARPVINALREALKDTDNKYVVRVANHALNVLLGTNNIAL